MEEEPDEKLKDAPRNGNECTSARMQLHERTNASTITWGDERVCPNAHTGIRAQSRGMCHATAGASDGEDGDMHLDRTRMMPASTSRTSTFGGMYGASVAFFFPSHAAVPNIDGGIVSIT